jgi:hypothetical protein
MKQKTNFNFQPLSTFVFLGFNKNDPIKGCSSLEDLSAYKIEWSTLTGEFCIHLITSDIYHFGIDEVTGLELWRRGHLKRQDLPAEFHENLPAIS